MGNERMMRHDFIRDAFIELSIDDGLKVQLLHLLPDHPGEKRSELFLSYMVSLPSSTSNTRMFLRMQPCYYATLDFR